MEIDDVWRVAVFLTESFGASARNVACELVWLSQTDGKASHCGLWVEVTKAIDDFCRAEPHDGEQVH